MKINKVPINYATDINNFDDIIKVYKKRYWLVKDDCLIYFNKNPMCNSNYEIVKQFNKHEKFYGCEVRYFDIVFGNVDINDYVDHSYE